MSWDGKYYGSGGISSSYYDDDDYYDDGAVAPASGSGSTKSSYYGSGYYGWKGYYSSSYYGKYGKKSYNYSDWYKSSIGSSSKLTTASYNGVDFSNDSELAMKAYKETRDMVIILDFPFDVKITFSGSDGVTIANDDRFIFMDTSVLEKGTKYDSDEKIKIICGLGVHEACHLKYTSYLVAREFTDSKLTDPSFVMKGISTEDTDTSEISIRGLKVFASLIFNVIEDTRVEGLLLQERPGYSELLQIAKNYRYDRYSEKIPKHLDDCDRYIDTLVKLIRFPDKTEDKSLIDFDESFKEVKKILSSSPANTKDSCVFAINIFNEAVKYLKSLTKAKNPSADDKEVLVRVLTTLSALESTFNKAYLDIVYGTDGMDSRSLVMNRFAGYIPHTLKSETAATLVTGKTVLGKGKHTYFIKPDGHSGAYISDVTRIKSLIPAMRKIVFGFDKNYDFDVYGCRSGLLDTTKLAEAYQGVPQVYIRKGEVRTNKVAVCVLIDESGSMAGYLDDIARRSAILINEALGKLPGVDLYIYGHSGDQNYSGSTEIYVYREGSTYNPKYALSESHGRCQNRDGTAIFEVASRVKSLTSDKAIMIVLSDGEPCANGYYGHTANTDVKDTVEKVEKMGINVIQVTIGPVHNVDYMFPVNIDLQDNLETLPLELSKVVKKYIVENKNTTIK